MKRKSRFSFLLLLGILLVGAGLIGLATAPDLIQYAFLPPSDIQTTAPANTESLSVGDESFGLDDADYSQSSGKAESDQTNTPLLEKYDKTVEDIGAFFPQMTLHSIKNNEILTIEDETRQDNVCLYALGPFWHDLYTTRIVEGRPLVRLDAEQKSDVIVLDEETAFLFFRGKDPIGQTVTMSDGTELEVVGVAKHSRRIGELGKYAAWVPLDQVTNSDMMVLSVPSNSDSMMTMLEKEGQANFGKGTIVSLKKEKFRALLPLLLIVVIVMIWLLKRWFGWLIGYAKIQVEKVRVESKRRYLMKLLPYAAGQLLPATLLIVLSVAACFGVAILALQPIGIFSEWVPETLGEYTAWIARFWNLANIAAAPVTIKTPEMIEVQFWSNLILWGTILILLRAAKSTLTGFLRKKED